MEQISLMNWLLEVDVEKTKDFYSKDIELCDCLYCQNYMEACNHIDNSVMEIFATFGINSSKPSHLSFFDEMEDGMRLYHMNYHIVGKLVEGAYCTDSEWNKSNTAEIENFTFGFNKDLIFVHDDFPNPVLQLEIEARIPWVLSEKPED